MKTNRIKIQGERLGLMIDHRVQVAEPEQARHGVRATHIQRPEEEVKRLIMPELFISL